MRFSHSRPALLAATVGFFLCAPPTVLAQALPGLRAAGMAGAFTAVADDASAVVWNPAGLVFGPIANAQIETAKRQEQDDTAAEQSTTGFVAVAVWPLGLSYTRSSSAAAIRSADREPLGRESRGSGLRQLVTSHVGITVLQSIGDFVTVGGTAKLIRGGASARGLPGESADLDELLDRAGDLDSDGATRVDADLGAMLEAGRFRVGVGVRNLTTPEFPVAGLPDESVEAKRQVRTGIAWGSAWPARSAVTVALDADLTRGSEATGARRDLASGAETVWLDGRLALRAGARVSTAGAARPAGSAGTSIRVTSSLFADVQASFGQPELRGWGIGGRAVF